MELKIRAWDGKRMMYRGIHDRNWYTEPKQGLQIKGCNPLDRCMKTMLFVGLKDKNDREIYEGDIAESIYGIGTVTRDERGFMFEFSLDTDSLWSMCTGIEGREFEIIGNIYENPELIGSNA